MHIGIEGHGFWGEGGSQTRYVYQLVRALARLDRRNRYTVFFNSLRRRLPGQRWFQELLGNGHFSYVMTHLPNTGIGWWEGLRRDHLWPRAGHRRGVGLFHSTAQRATYRNAVPSVLTVHDLAGIVHPEWFPPSRAGRAQNRAVVRDMQAAEAVLASSQHTRRDILSLPRVAVKRVETVLLGVDTERFHPVEDAAALARVRERYGIGGPYLLHVGDLVPRKNLERLIRIFARLKQRVRLPHRLVLAGKRNYGPQDLLELPEHLGIGSEVVFPGFVPEADLPALYSGAAAFVYPSLYEGFGLPVLEAMACGAPIICSSAASLVEVAGEAAMVLDPLDEAGWLEAMRQVLEDEALRGRLREHSLRHVNQFSWERTAQETLAVYRRLGAA